jgi:hypothetical protein
VISAQCNLFTQIDRGPQDTRYRYEVKIFNRIYDEKNSNVFNLFFVAFKEFNFKNQNWE